MTMAGTRNRSEFVSEEEDCLRGVLSSSDRGGMMAAAGRGWRKGCCLALLIVLALADGSGASMERPVQAPQQNAAPKAGKGKGLDAGEEYL